MDPDEESALWRHGHTERCKPCVSVLCVGVAPGWRPLTGVQASSTDGRPPSRRKRRNSCSGASFASGGNEDNCVCFPPHEAIIYL